MGTRGTCAKPSCICFAELKYAIPKSLPNWAEKQEQGAKDFPGLHGITASHLLSVVENHRIEAEKDPRGHSRPLVLKHQHASKSPGVLVKIQIAGPHLQSFCLGGSGRGPEFYIFNRAPDNADDVHLWPTL